jgi:DNA-binding NarL/FixJ family response regulator
MSYDAQDMVDVREDRPIRILIADQHSLFRQALRDIFDRETDLRVVADAGDEALTLTEVQRTTPDIVLVDAGLLGPNSTDTIERIRELEPDCRVVVLSSVEDGETLAKVIESGAHGYLTKDCALSEVMAAARAVHEGDTLVPPGMLGDLLSRLIRRRRFHEEATSRLSNLSRRERQVLALLAEGGNKETIARALVISPETVRTHIQHVLAKLGVHSRLEAAAFAIQGGIVHEAAGSRS